MKLPQKILVTDDDPTNRKLVETLLRSGGHTVHCVDSGRAALDSVATDPPDLILLDLMMPDMDGFEVVRRLKANPFSRGIRIIMLTALDDAGSRARLKAAGVSDVISKPIDRWALHACIDNMKGEARESQ